MHTVRISILIVLWEFTRSKNIVASSDNPTGIHLDRVEGLAVQCGYNLIAVGSRQLISIYSQDLKKDKHIGELVGSIPLSKPVSDSGFLELKFISESQLFYCDAYSCSLCEASNKVWSCEALVLSWNGESSTSILDISSAYSLEKGKLYVRVAELTRAAVLAYTINNTRSSLPVQSAPDAPYIRGFSTVSGFSRGMYIYFVGSAVQPYEPFINSNLGNENRTITKITRICSSDLTSQLESRIDLAIDCGFGDINKRVEASYYDAIHDQITVVLKNDIHNWSICAFSMTDVEERFNRDWDLCQKTTRDSANNCQTAGSAADIDDHCYIFTRKADAYRMQTCIRFGQDVQRIYDNCNLHQHEENSYRYGWLEDFRPLVGTPIASVTADIERVVSVLPDFENEALFVGGFSGSSMSLLRVSWQPDGLPLHSRIFWKRRSFPSSRFPMCLDSNEKTLFMLNSTTVIRNQISCAGLYSTCEDLAEGGWQDPLSCIWCPDEHRLAVTSSYDKLGCLHPITKTCPPIIDHANRNEHAEWEIFGSNMDRMQDIEVFVCDEKCQVNRQLSSSTKLLCSLPEDSDQDAACNVRVVGRLEGYNAFTLEVKKTTHSVALMTERSSSSRTWKEIVAVVVVVIILTVLGVIICLARKKMRKKGSTMEISNSNVYDDGIERYLSKLEHNLVDFVSPYEQMFRDIDNRLKIDFSSLHIEEEIGRGHFGIVSRATYIAPDGTTKKVACKILKQTAGIGDFITEGITMGRFSHPNLMQLVGIAFTDGKIPVIVTDYMENGDLRTYLRDDSKIITLRSLLRFACQIAQGMEHLHSCRSVHCDLAARNCMLDNDLNIKIGDFGLCRRVSDDSEAYEPSNKHRDVPFPWMAPEAIISETFTFQNDVWAYGVVLWELTTRGLTPYGGKKGIEIIEFLRANRRLQMPEYCPAQLYHEIMLPCWHADPQKRPTFAELVVSLNRLVDSMETNQSQELCSNYEKISIIRSDSAFGIQGFVNS